MALTSPLKLYKRKATGSGSDKFDELCLDASSFKVTWNSQTLSIPDQLERLQPKIITLTDNDSDQITLAGYMLLYDDEGESSDAPRPNNSIFSGHNLDVYFYSTGMSVRDATAEHNYQYSYPNHSGTFAMTNDIGLTMLDLRGYAIS